LPLEPFEIRPAGEADRVPMALVLAAVAAERDGIATEPPVDVEARAAAWTLDGDLVAVAEGEVVGSIHVEPSRHGYGEIGMAWSRASGEGAASARLCSPRRSLPKVRLRRGGTASREVPARER
jgi:hypothetical protein